MTLAGTPRRRSLHHDGVRAPTPARRTRSKKPALREPRDRPKRGNHFLYGRSPNVPTLYGRGTTWSRRQALGTRQARVGLSPTWEYTWEYSPRSSGPTTPLASGDSTKSYHQGHPRTFHEEPGKRDCGAEGYQPGGHAASLQATFHGGPARDRSSDRR